MTPTTHQVTADLGAASDYLAHVISGSLAAGGTDRLSFSLRQSELDATATDALYLGVIVHAEVGSTLQPGIPELHGLTPLASNSDGGSAFALYKVDREGLQLLEIAGEDAAT